MTAASQAVARIRRVPQLLRRMRAVREPVAFARAEVRRRPSVGWYHLRSSGLVCGLRHHENDLGALDDVVLAGEYEPPPPVAHRLAARTDGPRILDLGGHVGLFALDAVARYPQSRITAVEPDAASAALYREVVHRNGLGDRVEVIQAAAGTSDGTASLAGGLGVASHVTDDDGSVARPVRTVDVLPLIAEADLVKMDVEGAEWTLLADPRAIDALGPAVVLEFHERGCPDPSPEATAVRALRAAGLTVWPQVRRLRGMGLLWAYDEASAPES